MCDSSYIDYIESSVPRGEWNTLDGGTYISASGLWDGMVRIGIYGIPDIGSSICVVTDVVRSGMKLLDDASGPDIGTVTYKVHFLAHVSNFAILESMSLQENILSIAGEPGSPSLRIYNPTINEVSGMSVYFAYPSEVVAYINKIQCFCSESVQVHAYETVELPVLPYIDDHLLQHDSNTIYMSHISSIQ